MQSSALVQIEIFACCSLISNVLCYAVKNAQYITREYRVPTGNSKLALTGKGKNCNTLSVSPLPL